MLTFDAIMVSSEEYKSWRDSYGKDEVQCRGKSNID